MHLWDYSHNTILQRTMPISFEPHITVNFQHFPSFQVSDVAMGSSSELFPFWMYLWLLAVLQDFLKFIPHKHLGICLVV